MSQQTIESVMRRMACDEEFRQRCAASRAAVLDEPKRTGSTEASARAVVSGIAQRPVTETLT